MNQFELLVCCVENYSHIKNVSSDKVAHSFYEKGIFQLLLEGYNVYCGMDEDFLIGMIDGYVENTTDAEQNDYNKHKERQSVLPKVLKEIAKQYHMTKIETIKAFYASKTGQCFAQDDTQYYNKTAEELIDCYKKEIE
ncbi:MAG: DUF3791 domain-containing protein [Firmicutes bacterium]|jgi:glucan phosphorylase|nr:DUF3791 domain-containing protein [Bacillota bacterium]